MGLTPQEERVKLIEANYARIEEMRKREHEGLNLAREKVLLGEIAGLEAEHKRLQAQIDAISYDEADPVARIININNAGAIRPHISLIACKINGLKQELALLRGEKIEVKEGPNEFDAQIKIYAEWLEAGNQLTREAAVKSMPVNPEDN